LRIEVLRRQRRTCGEFATAVGVSRATVARIVGRCGWALARAGAAADVAAVERAVTGELVHLDTKELGRIVSVPATG
jgi:hypothetical protein